MLKTDLEDLFASYGLDAPATEVTSSINAPVSFGGGGGGGGGGGDDDVAVTAQSKNCSSGVCGSRACTGPEPVIVT
ncbi:hypothetical protein [Tateyamaria omphalii]|uniref:Uncharacterized protein n=1 Tax=Tateyamaria omphalii TaxID=299262 RepID=A0A1P8MTE8_9RHOB|nr:hypothetical protein [Tateyamaria omphalii]APX11360.1 hypothetical protein BWR18_06455 [Tateyamaria omphalii]